MNAHQALVRLPAEVDPHGTLARALWIGGAQWAGKSTVSSLLAGRYGLTAYHYDFHDARAHDDRRLAGRVRAGERVAPPDLDAAWVHPTPEQMARETLTGFASRFEWTLDDLRALDSPYPVLAEGWGLRPEMVRRVVDSPRRMVVMVPTEEFRQYQLKVLPRAGRFHNPVSDPVRAQQNRLNRDRLLAADVVRTARELDVTVIEVDGSRDAEAVTDLVAELFADYLPKIF